MTKAPTFWESPVPLALLSVALWSTSATAFKLTLSELNYQQMLLWSSASSLVFLAGANWKGRTELARWQSRDWLRSVGAGALNPFLYYLLLFRAFELLPAQVAIPLNWTWPLILSLLAVPVLGHVLSWRAILGMMVSLVGVCLVAYNP